MNTNLLYELKLKRAFARNFICFGPEGITIDFGLYGNIVTIRGENLDVVPEQEFQTEKRSNNGIGKSTLPEIIVYGFYGKPIKSPKKTNHEHMINRTLKKKLYVEIEWDKYKVIRTREPNKLEFYELQENGEWLDKTVGGIPTTQKEIEKVLGMSYETFVNIFVFTDDGMGMFLECDADGKRSIVENLLGLENFRSYFQIANKKKNKIKNDIKLAGKDYEYFSNEVLTCENRIKMIHKQENEWIISKNNELERLKNNLKIKNNELKNTDIGNELDQYNQAQDKIVELTTKISEWKEEKTKTLSILTDAKNRYDTVKSERDTVALQIQSNLLKINNFKLEITKNQEMIQPLEGNISCPSCPVIENSKKIINDNRDEIEKLKVNNIEYEGNKSKLVKRIQAVENAIKFGDKKVSDIDSSIDNTRKEINKLSSISKPQIGEREKIIESQINEIKTQISNKKKECERPSPYVALLTSTQNELLEKTKKVEDKKKELEEIEKELPYYVFLEYAYSNHGWPKFAINRIIPSLNDRIDYWLQYLIYGKIRLQLNGELESTIETNPPDGNPYVYHLMSQGQRRRLNLAVCLAFAYIMSLSTGKSTSAIFLDEVSTNVDSQGVEAIYNMLVELSKDKQVFVTTHDKDLLEMLSGRDTMFLQMKDGFTKLLT